MEKKTKRFFRQLLEVFISFVILTSQSVFVSCSFFSDGKKSSSETEITAIRLSSSSLTTSVGGISYLSFSTTPNTTITPTWTYDTEIIQVDQQANGVVITGLSEGQTSLTCTYKKKSATAIITVSGYSETYEDTTEPYIYSDTTVMQMQPNDAETIHVSLYNGSAADIEGYTWTIENPSIASISPTGQYCTIKSLSQGYSRIKVTHSRAPYPYYIGVYVIEDISKVTFITTKDNIVKINTSFGEQNISVSLTNPKSDNYSQNFEWSVTEGSEFLQITANASSCVLTPVAAGTAYVRITHPEAEYPLDITVRVVEIVENVYIEPDPTILFLSGSEKNTGTVSASLIGLTEGKEYSNEDFTFEVEQENDQYGEGRIVDYYTFSNQISFAGKHNGSALLYIGHPKAAKRRQVLIITENQTADAVDASCMLTTTQNYIKTKVGAEETQLTVTLTGGDDEAKMNFVWTVNQQPDDGSSEVIELITTDGKVVTSRAAAQSLTYGTAYIKPCATGTATIIVTNSKSYYPLEILVKVLDATAVLEEQYYFTGNGIVKFLNSDTYEYSVNLRSAPESVKGNIIWESDSSTLHINANGENAELTSTANGSVISHITINHPSAQAPKEVLVLNADTQEELDSLKAFYSNKTYYSVNVDSDVSIYVNQVGFTDENGDDLDFNSIASQIIWTSSEPTVATVERSSDDPLTGIVTGNKSGTSKITIKYGETSATFTVTVYPKDVVIGEIEKSIYFTTTQNVIILGDTGMTKTATVTAVGMDSSKYGSITWSVQDESVATVIANGTTATITSVNEGETEVHVSHPDSENMLKIYIRVGSEYVTAQSKVTYISATTDIIAILKDTENYALSAVLVNPEDTNDGLSGFSFSMEDNSIASIIAQYATGNCYIKPENAGQTEITISHPKSQYPKKVLVIVGNTLEELSEFKYPTTSTNVVNIGEGATKTITVSLVNATETIISGYTWASEDPSIASIAQTTSGTALISGNKIGTTRIVVTHEQSSFPLEIIVQIIDPIAASDSPFIQVPTPILTLVESSSWTTLTAELVGGSDSDSVDFIWSVYGGTDIVELYYQNGVGKVRAKKAGTATVRVTHPKAVYPQDITLVCDAASATEYSISVSSGNIMSIRPDSGDQTITATLVNGSTTDKYNFKWSLDVYDIIDMTYSANTAIITPLKEGTAIITITHPKSAYDQQIVVKVQQYNSFAFASVSKSVTAGQSTFITMQVPASSVTTTVSYYSEDDSVARISGTKAVCQITGVEAGTVTVHAQLIAEKTGVVQSEADMLVIVTPAAETITYITGTAGLASTFSMTLGTSKVMTAEVVGDDITIADQSNLIWSVPTDQNVLTLAGADGAGNVAGTSSYITAANAGETTLTITHSKTTYSLVYHIIVPGAEATEVTLDKNYVSIEKGKTTTVKATLSSGKSSEYKLIQWSISRLDGAEIATVNGTGSDGVGGQTVTLYGVKAGTVYLRCEFPESGSYAECQVTVTDPKTLTLDRQVLKVDPNGTKTFSYKVTPTDATINWVYSSAIDGTTIFSFVDNGSVNGEGSVTVHGIKEGTSNLSGVSSYGNKVSIQVQVGWEYEFAVSGNTATTITPSQTLTYTYSVSPADADISVSSTDLNTIFSYTKTSDGVSTGTGTITITPLKESKNTINITLKATNPNSTTPNEVIGTQALSLKFQYDTVTVVPSITAGNASNFASVNANNFTLADGQSVTLKFSVAEAKADAQITKATFVDSDSTLANPTVTQLSSGTDTYTISYPETLEGYRYRIVVGYAPVITPTSSSEVWSEDSDGELSFDGYSYVSGLPKTLSPTDFIWKMISYSGYETYGLYALGYSKEYSDFSRESWFEYQENEIIGGHADWALSANETRKGYKTQNNNISQESDWIVGTSFTRKRDTTIDGKTYSIEEFESIPWYYSPEFDGGTGGQKIHVEPHVLTNNIDAIKEVTTDTTTQYTKNVGYIKVSYTHRGSAKTAQIPIYVDFKNCLGTYVP